MEIAGFRCKAIAFRRSLGEGGGVLLGSRGKRWDLWWYATTRRPAAIYTKQSVSSFLLDLMNLTRPADAVLATLCLLLLACIGGRLSLNNLSARALHLPASFV